MKIKKKLLRAQYKNYGLHDLTVFSLKFTAICHQFAVQGRNVPFRLNHHKTSTSCLILLLLSLLFRDFFFLL